MTASLQTMMRELITNRPKNIEISQHLESFSAASAAFAAVANAFTCSFTDFNVESPRTLSLKYKPFACRRGEIL